MNVLNDSVLVLNSGMVPIDICSVRKAVMDIFREIAVPVKESDAILRSPSVSIKAPRIISYFGYHKIPRKRVRFTRLNVIYRDDQRCAYCRRSFPVSELTVDHVIPRSRWKAIMGAYPPYEYNSWENMVAACKKCNSAKGSRLLKEIGVKLERPPREPEYMPHLIISRKKAERMDWLDYCRYNVRLVEFA